MSHACNSTQEVNDTLTTLVSWKRGIEEERAKRTAARSAQEEEHEEHHAVQILKRIPNQREAERTRRLQHRKNVDKPFPFSVMSGERDLLNYDGRVSACEKLDSERLRGAARLVFKALQDAGFNPTLECLEDEDCRVFSPTHSVHITLIL